MSMCQNVKKSESQYVIMINIVLGFVLDQNRASLSLVLTNLRRSCRPGFCLDLPLSVIIMSFDLTDQISAEVL